MLSLSRVDVGHEGRTDHPDRRRGCGLDRPAVGDLPLRSLSKDGLVQRKSAGYDDAAQRHRPQQEYVSMVCPDPHGARTSDVRAWFRTRSATWPGRSKSSSPTDSKWSGSRRRRPKPRSRRPSSVAATWSVQSVATATEELSSSVNEISLQISGIQTATQESVNAIRDISATIERLSEVSSTIPAAVEEQGAATQEISRNVQQAAHGTQQISSNVTDVQRGAAETGSASLQVLSTAKMLATDSNRLKDEVGKFLRTVRAA
ncbi:bll5507 [Bradyrhizobium diazoefficiens USDA 110]|uniref:Bll5507 protein n=1 Tax=Bradyrhizobium diazoefficiens (strain JCM 10833 / BCRC 13528 / IAM 13628 / NBRC 14792 / USDA 110) TaxID=224911 RepID=Q89IX7_BRADU|nr:hypothetical protein Bdiaspc4_29070 [Bradyrhizobium diazoefficiens]BAC50772.1 bll5507 [Bradyrhizobium diazoefficiens USDA 110]